MLSAFIPCFNNASTLGEVAKSFDALNFPFRRKYILDDASTDDSHSIAQETGFEIIKLEHNVGRGAVRALAVDECETDLLLSCDTTLSLDPCFLNYALPLFEDLNVAVVFGRIFDSFPQGIAGRWRARHLFHQNLDTQQCEHSTLCTWAYVCRIKAIRDVGNFNSSLRHNEDIELGERLLAAGYKVVYEPSCIVYPLVRNTLSQCLERHWRWHVARYGRMTLADLRRWIGLACRSLVIKDLQAYDVPSACITLALPFHHWILSYKNRSYNANNTENVDLSAN